MMVKPLIAEIKDLDKTQINRRKIRVQSKPKAHSARPSRMLTETSSRAMDTLWYPKKKQKLIFEIGKVSSHNPQEFWIDTKFNSSNQKSRTTSSVINLYESVEFDPVFYKRDWNRVKYTSRPRRLSPMMVWTPDPIQPANAKTRPLSIDGLR